MDRNALCVFLEFNKPKKLSAGLCQKDNPSVSINRRNIALHIFNLYIQNIYANKVPLEQCLCSFCSQQPVSGPPFAAWASSNLVFSSAKPTSERFCSVGDGCRCQRAKASFSSRQNWFFFHGFSNRHQRQSRQRLLEPVLILHRTVEDPAHQQDRTGSALGWDETTHSNGQIYINKQEEQFDQLKMWNSRLKSCVLVFSTCSCGITASSVTLC